ncbi:DNRLRE domain-containing protein [Bacillus wiedmannii]|uniref:DNRLRE domain-containing protein n=3 Tax=Bacillus wiedmannii TaxID=1890302 RepID=UPI0021CEE907|nr:DNRLRE domain-containing protein [Bacillus wiedmannii]MCU5517788.1 DNRLRE domain-containing protein [Bacillus wiedmannii]
MEKKQVKKKWYRYFIQLMVVALIVTSIPMNGLAETVPPFTPSPNSEPSPQVEQKDEKELPAPHPDQIKQKNANAKAKPTEVVEERTETEKVFDNQDGTFTKKIYTEPIHAEKNGKLEEVSTNLVESPDKKIVTENTALKPKFEKVVKDGKYVQFEVDGHTIQYELTGARGEKGELKPTAVTASHEENTVWYKGIFPSIDLKSTTFNENVKEDFVLHQYTGHHIFSFELQTDLQPSLKEDGSIIFQNEKKENVFVLPKPYMADSNINQESGEAVTSQDVKYEITPAGGKKYNLTVTADPKWLESAERKYPVFIDPSVTVRGFENAYASNADPNINYSGGSLWDEGQKAYTLKVGYFNAGTGTNDAFIKPDISNLKGATIQSATFHTYAIWHYYGDSPNGVWLDEVTGNWNVSNINWSNKPGSNNIAQTNVGRGKWAQFNVTNTVKAWVDGTRPNYGFKLHANGNGQTHWKKFVAAQNGSNAPYLAVNYSYEKLNKPRVQAYSNGTGSESGHFNIQWDAVQGAKGYKVAIFNGYDYEYIPVGNVTSWSTKDKKIFPTQDEINAGKFEFHKDGKGTDFSVSPGQMYKNAYLAGSPYGDYSSARGYWIRIVAEYPYGDSPLSDETVSYVPLEQVKRPSGSAYTNGPGSNTGYVSVKWDPVPEASGYKVWIYNGKDYEAFDVGNTTTWTTQGQNIWPTEAEISSGKYQLHHDQKGNELSLDPSPVYRNSGGIYGGSKNYWFRVTAYSKAGHAESEISQEFTPTFSNEVSWLGTKDYWAAVNVIGGKVTAINGNFVMDETDFNLSGKGPNVSIDRTYNSQDTGTGLFGKGWHSSLEEVIKEESSGNILYTTRDKSTLLFTKTGDNQYQAPNGIHLEVKKIADGFELKDKDQSVITFSKQGKVQQEKDSFGNVVKYEYDTNQRPIKITDASGRTITITYTGKFVSQFIGPENRTVTFEYENDQLVGSTTPEGKKYRYGYENGKLRYTFDPKHTETKPYKTTYTYENNKLVKVTDPLGKESVLSYNDAVKEVTLTDAKARKTVHSYNQAGNPAKIVVDAEQLKLTTTYEYKANHLEKTTTPKNQVETVTYDNNGNVTSVTDPTGTEKFEYNKNNDVIKATDVEDRKTTIAYQQANAAVSETNHVSETAEVKQYDKFGNVIQTSKNIGVGGNLLKNPSFEMDTLQNWTMVNKDSKGSMTKDVEGAPGGLGGSGSLKLTAQITGASSWGYTAIAQEVEVEPNTNYTLTGMVKTTLKNADAYFNVMFLDENGNPTGGTDWFDHRSNNLKSENGWSNRQLTFKTTDKASKAKIHLVIEHERESVSGAAWFDKLQLEKGDVSSSFNPIVNSSFEEYSETGSVPNWTRNCPENCNRKDIATEGFHGGSSIVLENLQYNQKDISYQSRVVLNQKQEQNLTLTAMSKSEKVENSAGEKLSKDYAVRADVTYQDGSTANFTAMFPNGTNDWNRSAVFIPATKLIKHIDTYLLFRNENKGKVWFDDIRLLEGNVLVKNEYDNDGNVTASYDEEGNKIAFSYDGVGNKKSETDERGNTKSFDYNKDNQLKKVTLKNGTSVGYNYDHNGNTTEKSIMFGGKTQTHKYEYDVDNKITTYIDALNRRIEYEYDANANKTKTKMPNGSLIEWGYDTADRIMGEKRNGKDAFTFERDANGQETKVKDHVNGVEKSKTYDTADRITSITDSRGGKIDWAYHDKANSKTEKLKEQSITHGGYNSKIKYEYNALDQNTSVWDEMWAHYNFHYDENGHVRTYIAPNDASATYNYDQTGKLSDLAIATPKQMLLLEKYEYDKTGNRTKIKHESPDGKITETNYVYDPINQLLKESTPNGTVRDYTYDGFGNRTSVKVTENGKETKSVIATFNEGNQLLKFGNESLTYDANGNRTSDGKYTYTWNEADQLVAVTKKGEAKPFATYKYDNENRRIEKNVNGQVTRYFYDGDSINPLYETDGNGKVLRQYVYNKDGVRLAMKIQDQSVYYHYNPRGDVIAMTDKDGQIVASYEYDAWGNVLKSEAKGIAADNPFGYAGYMYDKEIGMYYLIARYYNPEHGVFLSVDPDPGDEDDPVTMNGYTYADNNPVMMVDPDGHAPWWVASAAMGAGFGLASYLYKNRKSGYSWKGALKATGTGALRGLAFGGAGRVLGFITPLKGGGRLLGKAIQGRVTVPFKQVGRNVSRLVKNPKKHFGRLPGARLERLAKAKKNSTKVKLMRISNAIGKRK